MVGLYINILRMTFCLSNHPIDKSQELYSWGRGPSATVELRKLPGGQQVIFKRYDNIHWKAMWREYLALSYLRNTYVVPKVLKFIPIRRVLVLEWISGCTVLEWVLRRFGITETRIQDFVDRKRVKTAPDAMHAFELFKRSKKTRRSY